METEQYIEYSKQREELETSEDVLAFRKSLNSYSKKYHEELILESMDELSMLEYTEIEAIGYSPFVTLKVDAEDLNSETLEAYDIVTERTYTGEGVRIGHCFVMASHGRFRTR